LILNSPKSLNSVSEVLKQFSFERNIMKALLNKLIKEVNEMNLLFLVILIPVASDERNGPKSEIQF